MYRRDFCRPFVGECFDPSLSTSFTLECDLVAFEDGFSLGYSRIDIATNNRVSAHFSEVVGWVGLCPRSTAFQSIRIEEHRNQVIIRRISPENPENHFKVPADSFWSGWVVPGNLGVNGSVLAGITLMKYSPGEQDLIIPEAVQSYFLQQMGLDYMIRNNRLFVLCSSEIRIDLIPGGRAFTVPLPRDLLEIPGLIETMGRMFNRRRYCGTRIRFDALLISKVIVGRIFTRATGGVTLNFQAKSIAFPIVATNAFMAQFATAESLVPVVKFPVLIPGQREQNQFTLKPVRSVHEYETGLILVSPEERLISLGEYRRFGYLFVRVSEDASPFGRISLGLQADLGTPVMLPNKAIGFPLIGNPDTDILLVCGRMHVALFPVSRQTVRPAYQLVLPPAEFHSDQESLTCAVCLDEIQQGELEQRIEPCRHSFHPKCLKQWIERKAEPNCPICRRDIPRIVV